MKQLFQKHAPMGLVFLLALLVVVETGLLIGGYIYYQSLETINEDVVPKKTVVAKPTSALVANIDESNWNTYTDAKYGFQLIYPKFGVISGDYCYEAGGKCQPHRGECGKAIHEVSDQLHYIAIDNFFGIFPETWTGTITDYVKQKDPAGITKYTVLNLPSSDEAVKIEGLVANKQMEGPPPFAYTLYLLKKSNLLLSINSFQNPGNKGGCESYDKTLNWDIPKSFSFIK